MSQLESPRGQQFISDFAEAYGSGLSYLPSQYQLDSYPPMHPSFVGIRAAEMNSYLRSNFEGKSDISRAFLSEWLACIALQNNLQGTDYAVFLAPPQLERGGEGHSGIDLLLSEKKENNALELLLGINIKLKRTQPKRKYEVHKFDPRIAAPYCHLSLGDWQIPTREYESIGIRSWINEYVAPNILKTGKIPYFAQFQQYVTTKLSHTLGHYWAKVKEIQLKKYEPEDQEKFIIPPTVEEQELFYSKLTTVDTLFTQLLGTPEVNR